MLVDINKQHIRAVICQEQMELITRRKKIKKRKVRIIIVIIKQEKNLSMLNAEKALSQFNTYF